MHALARHIAVFCIALGLAAIIAFVTPLSVDPHEVFFYCVAAFFIYLGVSILLSFRRKA